MTVIKVCSYVCMEWCCYTSHGDLIFHCKIYGTCMVEKNATSFLSFVTHPPRKVGTFVQSALAFKQALKEWRSRERRAGEKWGFRARFLVPGPSPVHFALRSVSARAAAPMRACSHAKSTSCCSGHSWHRHLVSAITSSRIRNSVVQWKWPDFKLCISAQFPGSIPP